MVFEHDPFEGVSLPQRESEGPDRCRGTLRCKTYHDHPMTPGSLTGSTYNCCCCNPCHFIRPDTMGDGGGISPRRDILIQFDHCCRCVPRAIYARFVPDNPDDLCCVESAVPLFHQDVTGNAETHEIKSIYEGSLYGYTIRVELGRLLLDEYGSGEYEEDSTVCAWRIQITDGEYVDMEEVVEIDDDETTCLGVPNISAGPVEGPAGCMGTLVLGDFGKDQLPYLERESVFDFGYEGYPDTKFIDLDPVCGDGYDGYENSCEQVCSRVCVHGHRFYGGAHERVEFSWFEDEQSGTRGWRRTNPDTEIVEYLLLEENDAGQCIIRPDNMEEGLPSVVIDMDRGCSCRLNELFWMENDKDETVAFTVRCGFCSCWTFFCGTCRCVPTQLCVMTFIDGEFVPRRILDWDRDARAWESAAEYEDDYGYGKEVRILLGSDSDGECALILEIDGVEVDAVPWSCGDEMTERRFQPANDIITATFEKHDEDSYIWVFASSLIADCVVGPCLDATPCNAECGGHPASVTVRLHAWNDPYEDEPGIEGECDVEIEAYYWESWSWVEAPEPECGYIGFDSRMCDDPISGPRFVVTQVEIKRGGITVYQSTGGGGWTTTLTVMWETETCDPYYADTGVIVTGIVDCGWGCPEQTQRYQITATE